jgi:hypothetical protein
VVVTPLGLEPRRWAATWRRQTAASHDPKWLPGHGSRFIPAGPRRPRPFGRQQATHHAARPGQGLPRRRRPRHGGVLVGVVEARTAVDHDERNPGCGPQELDAEGGRRAPGTSAPSRAGQPLPARGDPGWPGWPGQRAGDLAEHEGSVHVPRVLPDSQPDSPLAPAGHDAVAVRVQVTSSLRAPRSPSS